MSFSNKRFQFWIRPAAPASVVVTDDCRMMSCVHTNIKYITEKMPTSSVWPTDACTICAKNEAQCAAGYSDLLPEKWKMKDNIKSRSLQATTFLICVRRLHLTFLRYTPFFFFVCVLNKFSGDGIFRINNSESGWLWTNVSSHTHKHTSHASVLDHDWLSEWVNKVDESERAPGISDKIGITFLLGDYAGWLSGHSPRQPAPPAKPRRL